VLLFWSSIPQAMLSTCPGTSGSPTSFMLAPHIAEMLMNRTSSPLPATDMCSNRAVSTSQARWTSWRSLPRSWRPTWDRPESRAARWNRSVQEEGLENKFERTRRDEPAGSQNLRPTKKNSADGCGTGRWGEQSEGATYPMGYLLVAVPCSGLNSAEVKVGLRQIG
jgi:hypothetical protein